MREIGRCILQTGTGADVIDALNQDTATTSRHDETIDDLEIHSTTYLSTAQPILNILGLEMSATPGM